LKGASIIFSPSAKTRSVSAAKFAERGGSIASRLVTAVLSFEIYHERFLALKSISNLSSLG
jgi:hypothetical protein